MEESRKAEMLAVAEKARRERILEEERANKEADFRKLQKLKTQLKLEKEANRANNSVVDLKMDDQPVGRLVLNHGQVYDFNLSTADVPKE